MSGNIPKSVYLILLDKDGKYKFHGSDEKYDLYWNDNHDQPHEVELENLRDELFNSNEERKAVIVDEQQNAVKYYIYANGKLFWRHKPKNSSDDMSSKVFNGRLWEPEITIEYGGGKARLIIDKNSEFVKTYHLPQESSGLEEIYGYLRDIITYIPNRLVHVMFNGRDKNLYDDGWICHPKPKGRDKRDFNIITELKNKIEKMARDKTLIEVGKRDRQDNHLVISDYPFTPIDITYVLSDKGQNIGSPVKHLKDRLFNTRNREEVDIRFYDGTERHFGGRTNIERAVVFGSGTVFNSGTVLFRLWGPVIKISVKKDSLLFVNDHGNEFTEFEDVKREIEKTLHDIPAELINIMFECHSPRASLGDYNLYKNGDIKRPRFSREDDVGNVNTILEEFERENNTGGNAHGFPHANPNVDIHRATIEVIAGGREPEVKVDGMSFDNENDRQTFINRLKIYTVSNGDKEVKMNGHDCHLKPDGIIYDGARNTNVRLWENTSDPSQPGQSNPAHSGNPASPSAPGTPGSPTTQQHPENADIRTARIDIVTTDDGRLALYVNSMSFRSQPHYRQFLERLEQFVKSHGSKEVFLQNTRCELKEDGMIYHNGSPTGIPLWADETNDGGSDDNSSEGDITGGIDDVTQGSSVHEKPKEVMIEGKINIDPVKTKIEFNLSKQNVNAGNINMTLNILLEAVPPAEKFLKIMASKTRSSDDFDVDQEIPNLGLMIEVFKAKGQTSFIPFDDPRVSPVEFKPMHGVTDISSQSCLAMLSSYGTTNLDNFNKKSFSRVQFDAVKGVAPDNRFIIVATVVDAESHHPVMILDEPVQDFYEVNLDGVDNSVLQVGFGSFKLKQGKPDSSSGYFQRFSAEELVHIPSAIDTKKLFAKDDKILIESLSDAVELKNAKIIVDDGQPRQLSRNFRGNAKIITDRFPEPGDDGDHEFEFTINYSFEGQNKSLVLKGKLSRGKGFSNLLRGMKNKRTKHADQKIEAYASEVKREMNIETDLQEEYKQLDLWYKEFRKQFQFLSQRIPWHSKKYYEARRIVDEQFARKIKNEEEQIREAIRKLNDMRSHEFGRVEFVDMLRELREELEKRKNYLVSTGVDLGSDTLKTIYASLKYKYRSISPSDEQREQANERMIDDSKFADNDELKQALKDSAERNREAIKKALDLCFVFIDYVIRTVEADHVHSLLEDLVQKYEDILRHLSNATMDLDGLNDVVKESTEIFRALDYIDKNFNGFLHYLHMIYAIEGRIYDTLKRYGKVSPVSPS